MANLVYGGKDPEDQRWRKNVIRLQISIIYLLFVLWLYKAPSSSWLYAISFMHTKVATVNLISALV